MQKNHVLLLISLSLLACSSATSEPLMKETPVDVQPTEAAAGLTPVLSTDLVRGCEGRDPGAQGPQVGQPAIEFALMDIATTTRAIPSSRRPRMRSAWRWPP